MKRLVLAFLLLPSLAWAQAPITITVPPTTPGGLTTELQYNNAGAFAGYGNAYPTALPTPAAPAAVYTGSAGGTTRYFTVVPVGGLFYGLSSPLTTVNGTINTLDGTHYVTVTTAAVTGVTNCDVYDFFGTTLFPNYVGRVACGSAIVDNGTYTAAPTAPFATTDNSVGIKIDGSLIVTKNIAIGNGVLGANNGVGGTSGNGLIVAAQTITGTSVGTNSAADPQNLNSLMTISPLCDHCVNQAWNLIINTVVPSANTKIIDAVEGVTFYNTLNGSGAMSTSDLLSTQYTAGGSWTGNGPHYNTNALTTWNSTGTVASLFGVSSRLRGNATGTVTTGNAMYAAIQGGKFTTATSILIDTPSGTVTDYCGLCIADGSAVGSSTTFGLRVRGATVTSRFDGTITLAGSSSGTSIVKAAATASGTATLVNGTMAALDTASQVVSGGATVTALSQSTGNLTMDCGLRPLQYITNGGAFTLTAPAADGNCVLKTTNNGSAGTITLSGFSPNTMGGASLTTTNGSKFLLYVTRVNGDSSIFAVAMQ